MDNAIIFVLTMLQIILAGYFIGDAFKHYKSNSHFLLGVDIALTVYIFLGIAASIFGNMQ